MIDWDSECLQMVNDFIGFEFEGYEKTECRGMAEALCAERLGLA